MNKACNQRLFTKMVQHLRKQNHVSLAGGVCAYRGRGGMKCAVGALISDAEYGEELEGHGVSYCSVTRAVATSQNEKLDDVLGSKPLLSVMQQTHDKFSPSSWEGHFKKIARYHGLHVPRAVK